MLRTFLRAKIHRAVVSEADLNYIGSITIPADLLRELDLRAGEQVDVLNINNGARFTTYVFEGEKPRHFCLNGAAARLAQLGDRIIIACYALLDEKEIEHHRIKVAIMDDDNNVVRFLENGSDTR